MTETLTTVVSFRFVNPALSVIMQLVTTVDELLVWNFEFGSLGFVWDLVFGAWIFHDFH